MGAPFRNSIVGQSGKILIPWVESPNFVTGISGWRIAKDGSVEFNNGVFRGSLHVGGVAFFDVDSSGNLHVHAATGEEIWLIPSFPAILIYDAAGNLTESISPVSGVDSAGHTFQPGHVAYDTTGGYVQLNTLSGQPQIAFHIGGQTGVGGVYAKTTGGVNGLQVQSPPQGIGNIFNRLLLQGGVGGLLISETDIAAIDPVAGFPAAETWHAYTFIGGPGWSNTAGSFNARYRKVASPPNSVEAIGDITAGSLVSGTQIVNAPNAAYAPARASQPLPTVCIGSTASPTATPRIQVAGDGSLVIQALPAGTTSLRFHGTYSLDA